MKGYIKGFLKYRFLLQELVKKGIKLKYRRSYLGIIWSFIEPLLTTIVLTIVFSTILEKNIQAFPVYILTGRLLYSFFNQATNAAMKSIRANQSMIKKVYVPKYLYPLASCMYNYVIFLISLIVLVGVSGIYISMGKIHLTSYAFLAIIPVINLFILAYGVGLILATISVFFRDMEYMWSVFVMIIMYASAIFYDANRMLQASDAWKGYLLKLNPLFCIIHNFRNCIYYGKMMSVHMLMYSFGFSIVCLIVGLVLFKKKQDKFILYI